MPDLDEQFSIDWLLGNKPKKSAQQDIGSASINEALSLYSQPIINTLRSTSNQEMRLHELVKAVNNTMTVSSFDEFRAVINRLVDREALEIAETDLTGNDLVRLRRR